MARQVFEIIGGGEGPETNLFGSEYIVSIAPAQPATLGAGSGDYGIWTSEAGPSLDVGAAGAAAAGEVRRNKKAA
jgi:hypothetical protein